MLIQHTLGRSGGTGGEQDRRQFILGTIDGIERTGGDDVTQFARKARPHPNSVFYRLEGFAKDVTKALGQGDADQAVRLRTLDTGAKGTQAHARIDDHRNGPDLKQGKSYAD